MNVTKLKHVVSVDECGSITAAALALNVTQSAVTRSVADVEQELGYALFDRRARGVVTTEEGRDFINRAASIVLDIEQLVEDAHARRRATETVLRVCVSPPLMQGPIVPAIGQLMRKNPDLRLHISAASSERAVRNLQRGDVDVVFGPRAVLAGEADFELVDLPPIQFVLFVRKSHPLAQKKKIRSEDIVDYPIISPDLTIPLTNQSPLDVYHKSRRDSHVIDYFPMVMEIAASSDAIGCASAGYAASNSFRRRFFTFDEVGEGPPLLFGFAHRRKWRVSNAARKFFVSVKALFESQP